MDPPTKFRPEVGRLEKRMEKMSVDDINDSGLGSVMDADSDSICSQSFSSASLGGSTGPRFRTDIPSVTECVHEEQDHSSIGYGSMEAPGMKPMMPVETRTATRTDIEIEVPSTVAEDSRQEQTPNNGLFANLLRHAVQNPDAMKPANLGDAISEEETATAPPIPKFPSVSDGPYQQNTYLHNYGCCGDSKYLLAPFRAVLAEQNEDGDSSLHLAIIHAQIPVVEHITAVWEGVPEYLNEQNKLGQTGMHLAIVTGQPRIVERLLVAGADPCRRDRNGDTCLHLAARYGDMASADLILDACQRHNIRRVTLEARNYHGFTAVHLATMLNRRDMLKLLVKKWGADADAQDYTAGRSPLHLAVEGNLLGIASMLAFDLEANVDARMYDNQTPLHIAAGAGNRGIVAVLVAAGAQTDVVDGEDEQPADLTYDTQILRLCNA